jgi:4-aminobutyrate aminotransferase-like enzyme
VLPSPSDPADRRSRSHCEDNVAIDAQAEATREQWAFMAGGSETMDFAAGIVACDVGHLNMRRDVDRQANTAAHSGEVTCHPRSCPFAGGESCLTFV